jgi:tRNA-splicing ligase RtcB
MKARELRNLGIPAGEAVKTALKAVGIARHEGIAIEEIRTVLRELAEDPERFKENPLYGELAGMLSAAEAARAAYVERKEPAPYRRWGENLEPDSVRQIENACKLPVSVRGALMPDAHRGYGLPIGGVLATRNAVIPYAVGMDIACRMKMSVLDLPVSTLQRDPGKLKKAIGTETRFGVGATFRKRREHAVMDRDWSVTEMTAKVKDKAWSQLGTSGSGNHFVEFGILQVEGDDLDLEPGEYLALLSHSGSRGAGAMVAGHYSKLAVSLHPELPKELKHLSWLDLDSQEGDEYWNAMQLMGEYAAANHACIHHHVPRFLGARVLLDIENHHNFAWKEEHDGETVVVHRKGATPADEEMLGIIPGSMASSSYVVRGLGNRESLNSASHGAGRLMSRTEAKRRFAWSHVRRYLEERNVTLLSAGIDEVPMAYKDIDEVMAAQSDLVRTVARFEPRIVKMAPAGERPED